MLIGATRATGGAPAVSLQTKRRMSPARQEESIPSLKK
jgi:hypothetical protein